MQEAEPPDATATGQGADRCGGDAHSPRPLRGVSGDRGVPRPPAQGVTVHLSHSMASCGSLAAAWAEAHCERASFPEGHAGEGRGRLTQP